MRIYTNYDTLHNFCKNMINKSIENEKYKPTEETAEDIIKSYHDDDDIFVEMVNDFINDKDIYVTQSADKNKYYICIKSSSKDQNLEKFYEICKKITNKDISKKDIEIIID